MLLSWPPPLHPTLPASYHISFTLNEESCILMAAFSPLSLVMALAKEKAVPLQVLLMGSAYN